MPNATTKQAQLEEELKARNEALRLCKEAITQEEKYLENHRRAVEKHLENVKRHQYERDDLLVQRDSLLKRMEIFRQYKRIVDIPSLEENIPTKRQRLMSPRAETTLQQVNTSIESTHRGNSHPQISYQEGPRDEISHHSTPQHSTRTVILDSPPTGRPIPLKMIPTARNIDLNRSIPESFWSTTDTVKLLGHPRSILIPDGSDRKLRCSAFHPNQPDILATTSDEGMLTLWDFKPTRRTLTPLCKVFPKTLRKVNACMESIAWHPTQSILAMAFRDPIDNKGSISITQWKDETKLNLQPTTVSTYSSDYHSKGLTSIGWMDDTYLITGGVKHEIVCWNSYNKDTILLHEKHKSEIRTICCHSLKNKIYSGGLDGYFIEYDFYKQTSKIIKEWRRPIISKINSILEHPANPNLILLSCIHPSNQNILLHDLRQRNNDTMPSMVWYKATGKSMSQHITPRWSTAGMHISCGSTTGAVYVWDIRACKRITTPHQNLNVHHGKVLHGLWHGIHNNIITLSSDRYLEPLNPLSPEIGMHISCGSTLSSDRYLGIISFQ